MKKKDYRWIGEKIKTAEKPMRKRPLYYNFMAKPAEQKTVYYFLISHTDTREIEDIASNVILARMPSAVKVKQTDGKIDGLHYRILEINTHNRKIRMPDIAKAYNGLLVQDNRLYKRQERDGLEKYVCGKLEDMLRIIQKQ